MSAKEPELQDFGITPKEYDLYVGGSKAEYLGQILLILYVGIPAAAFFITLDVSAALGALFLLVLAFFPVGLVAFSINLAIVRFKRSQLVTSPVASRIKLYEESLAAYRETERVRLEAERVRWESIWEAERKRVEAEAEAEMERRQAEVARLRKQREYWMGLTGAEFERELASLFQSRGYRVESTPSSGDQGIDLIVRKSGKTTIVQCKRHKSPVGPAIARELYGSLIASRADGAILACTGGFTKGVKDFVEGKPITLVDAWDIIKVADSIR